MTKFLLGGSYNYAAGPRVSFRKLYFWSGHGSHTEKVPLSGALTTANLDTVPDDFR